MDPNNVAVIVWQVGLGVVIVVMTVGRLLLSGHEYWQTRRALELARLVWSEPPIATSKPEKAVQPSGDSIPIGVSGKVGGTGDGSATARRGPGYAYTSTVLTFDKPDEYNTVVSKRITYDGDGKRVITPIQQDQVAERRCDELQPRTHRFDSGPGLQDL